MNNKMTTCKSCNQQIPKNVKFCQHCGAKNKKPFFKKWWFWVIIVVVQFIAIGILGGNSDNDGTNNDNAITTISNNTERKPEEEPEEETAKTEYYVGDILEDGNTRIVFMSSGDYIEENDLMQPADGKKYIYLQFAFENISKTTDISISFFTFECYADGYAAEMYYGGDDDLSATLSAGRATTGFIYFEVPIDAKEIEVEYETNVFTEEKIKFIFEGSKDSGYKQKLSTTRTEGAYTVGDVAESSNLRITYLSCEEYISDNMFVVPAEGYRFISCEFEFENLGKSDKYISSMSFDCYADGLSCKGMFYRDDDLTATLSAGRKTKGTVTFEVPIDAEVIEVEYLSNYWTSNRIVFTAK